MKTIGQRLRELRLSKKISQRDLADKINSNTGWISQMENDNMQPTLEAMRRYVDALGCNVVIQFVDKNINVDDNLIVQPKTDKRFN